MFEKADIKRWRRVVHAQLRLSLVPSDDPAYRPAIVLMGVYCFGTDVGVLAEVTGQTPELIRATLHQARAARILTGRTLRVRWEDEDEGGLAVVLDAMVAAGVFYRPVDPARSAAQKRRTDQRRRGSSRSRVRVPPGTAFRPRVVKSNPFYGLAEWKSREQK